MIKEHVQEIQEKLYPMRENWHLLKPYLNDKDVQKVLNDAMTAYCKQYPKRVEKMWTPGDAPWSYTPGCSWHDRIDDAVQEDEEFQLELNELFKKNYGLEQDAYDNDDLWGEMLSTEEYQALELKYYNKHSPKEGTLKWYQFTHGCHWINQFTAALISKALNVEVDIFTSDIHTCAVFVKYNVIYYADILNEWDSLQELLDFIGEENDFYNIF